MSLDLLASLTEEVGALLGEALRVAGAVEPPQLAPPTLAGAGDLSLSTHRYAKALRKAPDAIATMLAEVARGFPSQVGRSAPARAAMPALRLPRRLVRSQGRRPK
jgi:hypothetical protein